MQKGKGGNQPQPRWGEGLTPTKLVGMIKMLDLDRQMRIMIANPESVGGKVAYLPSENGEPELVILNNEQNIQRALDFRYRHLIESSKSLQESFWHINKPYRLTVLRLASGVFGINGEYEKILRDAWVSTEFPHQAKVNELVPMFERADPAKLMNESETDFLAGLPGTLTIYRGYSELQVKRGFTKRRGLSWTLDRSKAVWFAVRYGKFGARVMQATIRKSHLYMYTDTRAEKEVVVNPKYLRNLKISTEVT